MNLPPIPGPEKPPYATPCNGCGLCCVLQLCEVATIAMPEASAPCPALEWENGRGWCGLVRDPSRYLRINWDAQEVLGPTISKAIGAGQGCGMPDDWGQE